MNLPNDWIAKIETIFQDGRPNGFILEWDTDRFWDNILNICADCEVINNTDFNYSFCNTYEIEPESSSKNNIFILTLKISFITNAYCLYWTEYSNNRKTGKVVDDNNVEGLNNIKLQLSKFMENEGYFEIQDEWMNIVINGVELELSETATLEKCLFDDYES